MKSAQALDHHYFGLADDLERSGNHEQRYERYHPEKYQTCHVSLRKLSGVNMQRKTPPWNSTAA
jgi:hypothetical protein